MATIHKNLSEIGTELPSAADMRIGIVVSEWNEQITGALLEGAVRTLKNAGCDEQNIEVKRVPGTFELSLGAQFFAEYTDVDGVIVLGWGIVQLGMSIQSHDASQRTQGFLCLFGGLMIAFAKEILTAIGAI